MTEQRSILRQTKNFEVRIAKQMSIELTAARSFDVLAMDYHQATLIACNNIYMSKKGGMEK
ncbi:hypothetical protein N7478_006226 [Penicillium angulare]|uniref:uncharacterized protein n=1 Tax=Penicillium angulare TaxID=116970 RepID=UPI00253F797F|nr:uncharacterized protein N7478_006226 [Penicillium angulare]KAJ5280854.1 hypothetical protein N7478_006226 [Penicillium angulare]